MILNTETQSPEFLFSVKAMSRGHRVYCPSRMWRSRGFRGFPVIFPTDNYGILCLCV